MDISIGQPMSDINTWIYPWIYPCISISTATLHLAVSKQMSFQMVLNYFQTKHFGQDLLYLGYIQKVVATLLKNILNILSTCRHNSFFL